uniref:Membrane-associated progesterone receptor component 1 n=1 Tax=Caligus rogercresseyi TaxID=217165 RepID=C1BMH4_CALRO|nr:Membrane-associated progesterone receptor component 1 [Caligus rogercresseyi]ACO10842.1 Membrane-associated progesterone receptor component 1 [Caligus rogercresseyi]ACO11080.1 Membrane-associated progesterone receptor component 1 [Caligus rogercresseyi]|eukprot:TRINITY_DN987_c0_g1_i1.p1 TRINITY_DN987_c0_g1~~TRINITY_DN987_c0_g1_i1.p1  ORF type:complete len:198 (+),score=75.46 TRINITY_DN987_c0_g1_i1:161-754(+)
MGSEDGVHQDSADMSMSNWILLQLTDPVKVGILLVILWLFKKIFKRDLSPMHPMSSNAPSLPPLKKQDFTVEQLKKYDGNGEDGRILIAVNRRVYDVTSGSNFYGKDGPYGNLAGHDASRALAKFQVDNVSNDFDDLSDLGQEDMDQIREWDTQFSEKYLYVGKLLKPGEEATSYSDEDDDDEFDDEQGGEAAKKQN